MLNRLIVEVGRELCRVGRLERFTPPDIVVDGSSQYDLLAALPSAQLAIHDIDVVTLDGIPIDPISRGATRTPSSIRWTRIKGDGVDNIMLRPDPGSGALSPDLVLIPKPAATSLPDVLFEEWVEAVQFGVNAKGMSMAKKEWSDIYIPRVGRIRPGLSAQYNVDQYARALAKARTYGRSGSQTDRKRTIDGFQT